MSDDAFMLAVKFFGQKIKIGKLILSLTVS